MNETKSKSNQFREMAAQILSPTPSRGAELFCYAADAIDERDTLQSQLTQMTADADVYRKQFNAVQLKLADSMAQLTQAQSETMDATGRLGGMCKERNEARQQLTQAHKERGEAVAACAAFQKTLEQSGWHTCGCPGHWKEHAVNCPIGATLSFHPIGKAFLERMKEAEWLLANRPTGIRRHSQYHIEWFGRYDAWLTPPTDTQKGDSNVSPV